MSIIVRPISLSALNPVWGCIGDSITAGWGSTDPGTKAYPVVAGVARQGRPGQALLTAGWWPPLVETFEDELHTLYTENKARVFLAEIGINDFSFSPTDADMIAGYQTLKQIAARYWCKVVYATITPWGPGRNDVTAEMQSQRLRINTWIRTHRYYLEFAGAVGGNTLLPVYDSGDYLHPSDAGHAALAARLKTYIRNHRFMF